MDRKNFLGLIGAGGAATLLPSENNPNIPQKVIKPAQLHPGDTIGLISPASIVGDDEAYDHVAETIQQLGYEVKEGKHARDKFGYFAGTDKQRAADVNAMFADDSVDAIMPFRGGWGSSRILDYLDYELIQSHPKILVGFSDITALLLAIYAKTGLVTFHGPVAKSIWTEYTIDHFKEVLSSLDPGPISARKSKQYEDYDQFRTFRPGQATGRLLGGNLSVLTGIIGSEYLPDWSGSILFLEDVGEDVYRIDRMLTQLQLSGVLDQISGFVFGQCTNCDYSKTEGFTLNQILEQHIRPLGIPAFSGALFGHIDHMITLPVGLPATIEADTGTITFGVAAVQAR